MLLYLRAVEPEKVTSCIFLAIILKIILLQRNLPLIKVEKVSKHCMIFIKIYKDRDLHDLAFTAYSLQYLVNNSIPCSLISL